MKPWVLNCTHGGRGSVVAQNRVKGTKRKRNLRGPLMGTRVGRKFLTGGTTARVPGDVPQQKGEVVLFNLLNCNRVDHKFVNYKM